jgi:hypothetical protein
MLGESIELYPIKIEALVEEIGSENSTSRETVEMKNCLVEF